MRLPFKATANRSSLRSQTVSIHASSVKFTETCLRLDGTERNTPTLALFSSEARISISRCGRGACSAHVSPTGACHQRERELLHRCFRFPIIFAGSLLIARLIYHARIIGIGLHNHISIACDRIIFLHT